VSQRTRWTITALLAAVGIITATTRVVAVDDVQADEAPAESDAELPPPNASIEWTDIPTVDVDNPILHRGVVLGPDGTPLAGASVYAASTIELFDLRETDDIGPVRAVTDDQGRFEFEAEDLSWVTQAGERKRWETLLVVTSEGIVSGWLKTWGRRSKFSRALASARQQGSGRTDPTARQPDGHAIPSSRVVTFIDFNHSESGER
jgi:hypothetical protein